MLNKTYIHYPADRLIEGKLWPHLIQNIPKTLTFPLVGADKKCWDNYIQDFLSYREALDFALANSIPFDKEFVEQIRIAIAESDDYNGPNKYQREPSPEKIYGIEGIETYKKYIHFHEECRIECICDTDDVGHITVAIKHAKEEPQESQKELWEEAFKIMNEEGDIESKFHIQRK